MELLKRSQWFARIETVDYLECIRQHSRKRSQRDHFDRAGRGEEQKRQHDANAGIETNQGQIREIVDDLF